MKTADTSAGSDQPRVEYIRFPDGIHPIEGIQAPHIVRFMLEEQTKKRNNPTLLELMQEIYPDEYSAVLKEEASYDKLKETMLHALGRAQKRLESFAYTIVVYNKRETEPENRYAIVREEIAKQIVLQGEGEVLKRKEEQIPKRIPDTIDTIVVFPDRNEVMLPKRYADLVSYLLPITDVRQLVTFDNICELFDPEQYEEIIESGDRKRIETMRQIARLHLRKIQKMILPAGYTIFIYQNVKPHVVATLPIEKAMEHENAKEGYLLGHGKESKQLVIQIQGKDVDVKSNIYKKLFDALSLSSNGKVSYPILVQSFYEDIYPRYIDNKLSRKEVAALSRQVLSHLRNVQRILTDSGFTLMAEGNGQQRKVFIVHDDEVEFIKEGQKGKKV